MSVSLQQIEDLKRGAPLLQAIIDLVATFEKIGSVDQAVAESNQRLAIARAAEADFKKNIRAQREEIETMRKAAVSMTEQAQADAANIVASAQSQAASTLATLNAVLSGKNDELTGVDSLIAEAQAKLDALYAEDARVQAQINEFNTRVAATKAELLVLAGT